MNLLPVKASNTPTLPPSTHAPQPAPPPSGPSASLAGSRNWPTATPWPANRPRPATRRWHWPSSQLETTNLAKSRPRSEFCHRAARHRLSGTWGGARRRSTDSTPLQTTVRPTPLPLSSILAYPDCPAPAPVLACARLHRAQPLPGHGGLAEPERCAAPDCLPRPQPPPPQ